MKYNEKFESQNQFYSTGSMNSINESNNQSSIYHLPQYNDQKNSYNKIKKSNKNISIIKNIHFNKTVYDEKLRIFRIMLAGDSEVGKTSLLLRMCDDIFKNYSVTTIGVDMKMKSVEVDGKKAMMQIWDTAGQESWKLVCSLPHNAVADGIRPMDVEYLA
ncbi:unnamed protein product [Schistosoma curassoni]|uniref:Rab GTPase n=1 Tax=Schistosoma curassoni TaxID=6186 RepID=A0A183JD41_9TREM|nr:unnamed protein product [Schistosoma curassoni]